MVLDVAETSGELVRAERITRLGASILDTLIIGTMIYGPFFVGIFITATISPGQGAFSPMVLLGPVAALIGLVAWVVFTVRFLRENGQSIGKRMLSIKVVRSDGSPASLGRIFWLRIVLNTAISFVPLYGLIDSLFIFSESQQCLHDKIADTIVVKA